MSYGMQVLNSDGRTVFHTDEEYASTQISNITTSAYTAMTYPPSNYAAGDLILARPVANANGARETRTHSTFGTPGYVPIAIGPANKFYGADMSNSYTWNQYGFDNTTGIVHALVKKHTSVGAPSSGEYGLDVLDSSGAILFSNRASGLRILASGTLTLGTEATYTPPASLNFSKIYGVMNGTYVINHPGIAFTGLPSHFIQVAYHFYPDLSTPKILIRHKMFQAGNTTSQTGTGTFTYMLMYDPN